MGKRKQREAKARREAKKARKQAGFPQPTNVVRIPDGPPSKSKFRIRANWATVLAKMGEAKVSSKPSLRK